MYIAVREDSESSLYYKDDGKWTIDKTSAMKFETPTQALSTSNFHQMYDVIVEQCQ